ncbi:MAG: FixH family protein [Bacteroidota bacterium]
MNWGTRIVFVFIAFAAIIISMVVISMKQDINLVAEDYYAQEIQYQDQINRMTNNEQLEVKPTLAYDQTTAQAKLVFPVDLISGWKSGEVHFFRPSDASLDTRHKIALDDEGKQVFDLAEFRTGLWKAKITWQSGDKAYYEEITLVI